MEPRKIRIWYGVGLMLFMVGFAHESEGDASFIHLNKAIAKLDRGLPALGLYVSSIDPSNAIGLVNSNGWQVGDEVYTKPALDFLIIEMEHEPYNVEKLRTFLLALNSKREVHSKGNLQPNLVSFVALPLFADQPLQHWIVQQVLDLGVFGLYSTVNNAEEATNLVRSARYPQQATSLIPEPRGRRANYPLWASYLWGLSMKEYTQRADVWPLNSRGDLMLVVHIETEAGISNIDSILDVPGIGAAHFGPRDYSFSIGHPLQTDHPAVTAAWERIQDACDRRGIPLIVWADETNIESYLSQGSRMIVIGTDTDNNFGDATNWGSRGAGKVIDVLRQRSP